MSKSVDIYAQVELDIKEQAEQVLSKLGLPMANAINLFLHQIVLRNGIPFEVLLPQNKPLDYSAMSPEEFDAEIEKGFNSLNEGKVISSSQVRERIQRQFKS